MFVLREKPQSPFQDISTNDINFATPHFVEIDGRSVLVVTGQTETPIYNGVEFITSFNGNIDYYVQAEGGKYIRENVHQSPLQNLLVGSRVTNLTVADFDNDGQDDLIHSFNRHVPHSLGTLIGDGVIEYYRPNADGIYQSLEPNPFANLNKNTDNKSHTAIDFNGDGWLDLMVQASDSNVPVFYLNNDGVLEAYTGKINLPNAIASALPEHIYSFDEDGDGDFDVAVKNNDGSLSLFRNQEGTYTAASNNPFEDLDVSNEKLAFNDVDGDGDVDFVGITPTGKVNYYENLTVESDRPPIAADDYLDVFNTSSQELDVMFNDYGAQGQALTISNFDSESALGGIITLDDNDTTDTADDRLIYTAPTGITNQTEDTFTYTVTDADGQTDTATVTLTIFPRLFTPQEGKDNPLNDLDVGGYSSPAIVDWDGDGDGDLFTGNGYGTVQYFRNDNGEFIEATDNPFDGIELDYGHSGIAIADFDLDGDFDAVMGSSDNTLEYFRNDDGTYTKLSSDDSPINFFPNQLQVSYDIKPTAVDWDGDGLMDLVTADSIGQLHYFHNQGGVLEEVALAESPFKPLNLAGEGQELYLGEDVSVAFSDFDGDGDLDILAGNSLGQVLAFRNDGDDWTKLTAQDHPFGEYTDIGIKSTVATGDLDGDGDLEAIVGSRDGTFLYWEGLTSSSSSENFPPTNQTDPGDDFDTAFDLGTLDSQTNLFQSGTIGGDDIVDAFQFTLDATGEFTAILDGLSNDVNLGLWNSDRVLIDASVNEAETAETLNNVLAVDTYYLGVISNDGLETPYDLTISLDNEDATTLTAVDANNIFL
ncbi:MAG: hypothetical protein Tsb0014_20720 [Pleurocapsa sp.]